MITFKQLSSWFIPEELKIIFNIIFFYSVLDFWHKQIF